MDQVRETWGFSICGELIFGNNATNRIGKAVKRYGGTQVLVVTDPVIRDTGLLEKVRGPLEESGIPFEVFDQGEPEPSIEKVLECTEFAKKGGNFNLIICLGGGSIIDLGKATAVLLAYGKHPNDYFGEGKVPGPVIPIIAIPTTAGTGSEISPSAILTDVKANVKKGISDNKLRPKVAMIDPILTLSCPPNVTAATGIDVLSHAIESFIAVNYAYLPLQPGEEETVLYHGSYPLTDCLAIKAVELVSQNLRIAVHQGKNLEARENMAMANIMAGMAFSNSGVTAVHAMAYPLGAVSNAPHGIVNGLILPHVMEYNLPVKKRELADLAKAMGEKVDGLSKRDAALKAIDSVNQLIKDIGLPHRMRDIGVKEKDIRPMAEAAIHITRLLRSNPRMVNVESLEGIYKRAF